MRVREFVQDLRARRGKDLLVFACSGSKRTDEQIQAMTVEIPKSEPLGFSEDYRACIERHRPEVVDFSSREFPACLRYCGTFYKQIPVGLWKELVRWPILILSARYGLIRPTDGIRRYDLRLQEVEGRCFRMLPQALIAYLKESDLQRALFFTSRSYMRPFSRTKEVQRVAFLDGKGEEIRGPYGRDYYRVAGLIVRALVSGDVPAELLSVKVKAKGGLR